MVEKQYLKHTGLFTQEKWDSKCGVRARLYGRKAILKTHMIVHSGIKDFECEICGKSFIEKMTLKRPITVHSGIENFKCKFSGKLFGFSASLRTHIRSHQELPASIV